MFLVILAVSLIFLSFIVLLLLCSRLRACIYLEPMIGDKLITLSNNNMSVVVRQQKVWAFKLPLGTAEEFRMCDGSGVGGGGGRFHLISTTAVLSVHQVCYLAVHLYVPPLLKSYQMKNRRLLMMSGDLNRFHVSFWKGAYVLWVCLKKSGKLDKFEAFAFFS